LVVTALALGGCEENVSSRPASRRTTTTVASGVYGVVAAGPTCPVERVDQPCPPRPVSAEVEARTRGGRLVAKTASANTGRYDLALAPGGYILTVVTSGLPRCPPAMIIVKLGAATHADITCDTGIR
jgi:hypothetical protein